MLRFTPCGEPPRLIRRGGRRGVRGAAQASRIPAGHPEGYLEGFAQLYRDVADQLTRAYRRAQARCGLHARAGRSRTGVRGMRFITAAVASSRNAGAWTDL